MILCTFEKLHQFTIVKQGMLHRKNSIYTKL